MRYNEMMLTGKMATTVAETLTLTDDAKENRDIVLNLVISNLRIVTNWIEFYGLNFTETMELDFGAYHIMLSSLQEHNELIEQATAEAKSKIKNSLPDLG